MNNIETSNLLHNASQILLSHGVKPTPQRAVIAQYMLQTESHPKSWRRSHGRCRRIARGFCHAQRLQHFEHFEGRSVIREVLTEPGRVRYDANVTDHSSLCWCKNRTDVDIPADKVEEIGKLLGEQLSARFQSLVLRRSRRKLVLFAQYLDSLYL